GLALVSVGCSDVSTNPGTTGGQLTLTEVVPSAGPLAGNIPVEIRGTGFVAASLLVTFGGTAMTNASVVDANTIHGTLPPRSTAGTVSVTVACQAGQASLPNAFTYQASSAAISITGITPTSGPIA